jgi:putative phosphoribosyl transferase
MPARRFLDRRHAGRVLARQLKRYAGRPDLLVLGLPRGGVPVAYEVARSLRAPLDVFVVRKLGVPGHEELAMGAVASGGVRVLNEEVVRMLGVSEAEIEAVVARELAEAERREELYRGSREPLDVAGRPVILVDDGLATGASMEAAVAALRPLQPRSVAVAVPVAAADTCTALEPQADDLVCVFTPYPFEAVGVWYEDFAQTSDEDVARLLSRAGEPADARR